MAETETQFTHIGVTRSTQKQIAILAKVHGEDMYKLTGAWAEAAWQIAKDAGLVTDAMLEPQKAHVIGRGAPVALDAADKKKLLTRVQLKTTQGKRKALRS